MPYEGEFAKYRSIRRLVENERVKGLLCRAKIKNKSTETYSIPTIPASDILPSQWQPELVLAIDGSHQEKNIENGYPGAEVSYVTVASVLMDVAKIKQLDENRPVDPLALKTTEKVDSIDAAFPGCNVVLDDQTSADVSLRLALFEVFSEIQIPANSDALLGTYEVLASNKKGGSQKCPYEDDYCLKSDKKYTYSPGRYTCGCSLRNTLFSTDAMRIHEGMVPDSANGAMFAEIVQVLERILVIHILRWLEKNQLLWLLRHTGIVVDGPLALFGYVAGLLPGFIKELNRLNQVAKQFTDGQDILLVGVEKTGLFVNHFENIDRNKEGTYGAFPTGNVALLDDAYIKENIIFSKSTKPYGRDTYFGRKFFYKTPNGARIVGSVPFLNNKDRDLSKAELVQFPRLADILSLLNQLVSSRFPNSLSPLISAHAEAAIPMNLGSRVLEELARKLIRREEQ
ncbi:MAG: hypothetical protein FVQ83_04480 [Chloroflexi bacterium]|nr:hypothetical protein [Chloroflexota bacterium]